MWSKWMASMSSIIPGCIASCRIELNKIYMKTSTGTAMYNLSITTIFKLLIYLLKFIIWMYINEYSLQLFWFKSYAILTSNLLYALSCKGYIIIRSSNLYLVQHILFFYYFKIIKLSIAQKSIFWSIVVIFILIFSWSNISTIQIHLMQIKRFKSISSSWKTVITFCLWYKIHINFNNGKISLSIRSKILHSWKFKMS